MSSNNLVFANIEIILNEKERERLFKINTISQWRLSGEEMWGIFTPLLDNNTIHLAEKYIEGLIGCLTTIRKSNAHAKDVAEFCCSKKARHMAESLLEIIKRQDSKSYLKFINFGCLESYNRFMK